LRDQWVVQGAAIISCLIKASRDQLKTPSQILLIVRRARRTPSGWRIDYGREEEPVFGCQRVVFSARFAE
jgi:hypothetical protein